MAPHLPPTDQSVEEVLSSPQFQQALSVFGSGLQSGQLGPLMGQFGLGQAVTQSASSGGEGGREGGREGQEGGREGREGGEEGYTGHGCSLSVLSYCLLCVLVNREIVLHQFS